LINIWIDESAEEENRMIVDEAGLARSYYSAHAHALQSFIEKVTVFRSATKYKDDQLTLMSNNDTAAVKTYKLANLYDRYFEYANFLSTQGLVKEALTFVKLVPSDYKGSGGADLASERERILAITGVSPAVRESAAPAPAVPVATQAHVHSTPYGYTHVPAPVVPAPAPAPYDYTQSMQGSGRYGPSTNTYAPQQAPHYGHDGPYSTPASLTQPPHLRTQPYAVPAPPQSRTNGAVAPPPPPKRQDNSGWNDAPMITPSRTPANAPPGPAKTVPITSPFPNATPSRTGSPFTGQGQANFPPPPRPGSVQGRQPMPPPPPGPRMSGPPQPPNARSPSTAMQPLPPMHGGGVASPSRILSPPSQGPPRQPTPSQYAPPPSRGPAPGQMPPPSQFARPPPPGSGPYVRATPPPQPTGPYAPPTTQQQPGPYAPPPNQPQHHGQGHYAPPPAPQGQPGPYAPPPGSVSTHLPPPPSGAGGLPPSRGPGAPAGAGTPSTQAKALPPPPKYRECWVCS
jgi:protein transport protein SEC31